VSKSTGRGRDDDIPSPTRGVRDRVWRYGTVPRQAEPLIATGKVSDDVLAIAVEVHNRVADPRTGEAYAKKNYERSVEQAFEGAWTAAQEDSTEASLPIDQAYLERARASGETADEAAARTADVDTLLNQIVEAPSGAQLSRRQVADEHRTDYQLARRREGEGDNRHRQRIVPRWVILVGAAVYGLVDLVLLYVPILNLGAIQDRGDLIRWLIALILSVAQAFLLELMLREHQEAERDCTDLRNAVRDHDRDIYQGSAVPPPNETDIETADTRLRRAQYKLAALAGITAVLAAVRIAILVRDAGRPVAEAALFGGAVGIVLGLLVLVLGRVLCRGNALGDRLRIGGEIVAETEELLQQRVADVTQARDDAKAELDSAKAAKARGEEVRRSIASLYWEGMQLAAIWLDVGRPPTLEEGSVRTRPLSIVKEADRRVSEVEAIIQRIGIWLGEVRLSPDRLPLEPAQAAVPAADKVGATSAGTVADQYRGRTARSRNFLRPEVAITPPPTEPRWPLAVGAVLTVVAAVVAAVGAPTIEEALAAPTCCVIDGSGVDADRAA